LKGMKRMIRLWKCVSNIGAHSIPEQEKRTIIILNRINFFVVIIAFIGFVATYLDYCLILGGKPGIGMLRLFFILLTGLFSFFLTASGRYYSAKIVTSVIPAFFLIIYSTIQGDVAIEYYFYYPSACIAFAMIVILLFPRKEDRFILVILILFYFVLSVTSDNLLSHFSLTGKTPEIFKGRYFFYKIAQVLLFAFIVLTVFTLRDLNTKYEAILSEQNNILSAQKEELHTQSEKLILVNEELKGVNTSLYKSNLELEKYKNRLEELVELRTSALKESETRFKSLFENANDAIFIMKDDVFFECNLKTVEFFRCKKEQIIGQTPSAFSPPFQPDGMSSQQKAFVKIGAALKGDSQRFEWQHTRLDGSLFDAEVSLSRLEQDGQQYLLAIVRDITERKQAEEAQKNSEERLQHLVDSLTDIIYTVKIENGQVTYSIPEEGSMVLTGYLHDEFNADPDFWLSIVHEEDKQMVREQNEKLLAGLSCTPLEHRIIHKDGQIKWVRNTSVLRYNNKGNLIAYDGLISDITERKRAEEALKESEKNFRNIFEKSKQGIIIVSPDLKILAANSVFIEISGYMLDEKTPLYLSDLAMPDQHSQIKERLEMLIKGTNLVPIEYKVRLKDGSLRHIEATTSVMDYYGQSAFLIILRDNTHIKEAEHKVMEAIIKTEENERSRIAQDLHDGLGPVLSTIKIYFQVYQDTKDESKKMILNEKLKSTIEEAIKGVSEISHNISPHVLKNYGFYAALKQFIHRIALTNVVNINLDTGEEMELNENAGIILYRAIAELINNSIKHSGCENISIVLHHDGGKIQVDYSDDGKGFNVSSFIEKPAHGSGVQNIKNRVTALQGEVNISSTEGKGMHVLLKIPV
jgi:PAS domain S-box-containing protein